MESRVARSNAAASVARSLQEPERHRVDPTLAQGLLGAADHISRSVLTLEAYLLDNPTRHALTGITAFCNAVDEALHILATVVREAQQTAPLPNLQEALSTLERTGKADQQHEVRADRRFVLGEAKRIVSNIYTMNQLVSAKLEEV